MQRRPLVRKHGESRWPDGMLRNVEDFALFEVEMIHEPVQFARGNPPGGRFENLLDQPEEFGNTGARFRREEDHWRIVQELEFVADLLLELVLLLRRLALD